MLCRSAVRAVRDGRIADARLLYARALRCLRAAGDRADARAAASRIRWIFAVLASGSRLPHNVLNTTARQVMPGQYQLIFSTAAGGYVKRFDTLDAALQFIDELQDRPLLDDDGNVVHYTYYRIFDPDGRLTTHGPAPARDKL